MPTDPKNSDASRFPKAWPGELELLRRSVPPVEEERRAEARAVALEAFAETGPAASLGGSRWQATALVLLAAAAVVALAFLGGIRFAGKDSDASSVSSASSVNERELATLLRHGGEIFGSRLAGFVIGKEGPEWSLTTSGDGESWNSREGAPSAYSLVIEGEGGEESVLVLRPGFPVEIGKYRVELLEQPAGDPIILGDTFLWENGVLVGEGPHFKAAAKALPRFF